MILPIRSCKPLVSRNVLNLYKGVSKKSKKLVPRKPNENQKRTRYSKSNLAYIYKNKTELEVLENNKRFMKDLKNGTIEVKMI